MKTIQQIPIKNFIRHVIEIENHLLLNTHNWGDIREVLSFIS